MTVSTDGIIAFGVLCGEDAELPWNDEAFDEDIQAWWLSIHNFQNIHSPFTEKGDFAPGWSKDDPRLDEYFEYERQWLAAHPIPVEVVNYCSNEYPMYALVVPGSIIHCNRGYPESFVPYDLTVSNAAIDAFQEFLTAYKIDYEEGPAWFLMSYWG